MSTNDQIKFIGWVQEWHDFDLELRNALTFIQTNSGPYKYVRPVTAGAEPSVHHSKDPKRDEYA